MALYIYIHIINIIQLLHCGGSTRTVASPRKTLLTVEKAIWGQQLRWLKYLRALLCAPLLRMGYTRALRVFSTAQY